MTTIDRATARRVLDLPLPPNEPEADTVRDYLVCLVDAVWTQYDHFSGKRPFGTSGWKWDIYPALVKAGLIAGQLDSAGRAERGIDQLAADRLIMAAIAELGQTGHPLPVFHTQAVTAALEEANARRGDLSPVTQRLVGHIDRLIAENRDVMVAHHEVLESMTRLRARVREAIEGEV